MSFAWSAPIAILREAFTKPLQEAVTPGLEENGSRGGGGRQCKRNAEEESKKLLRETKIPSIMLQGVHWERTVQQGEMQKMGGELGILEMPRKMSNANSNNKMRYIGGPGVLVNDTNIRTSGKRVKKRMDQEVRKRKIVIHGEGVKLADDKHAKTEKYKLGRAWEKAATEEWSESQSESMQM